MRRTMLIALLFFIMFNFALAADIVVYNSSNSGLVDDYVKSIFVDTTGVVWFGTANGVCSYNGVDWKTQENAGGLAGAFVNDIDYQLSGYGDELWFATTTGAGVGSYSVDAITSATTYTSATSDLVSDSVTTVHVDKHNARWLGTANAGVSVFAGSDWYTFSKENFFLSGNRITTVASGPDSFYYIGTLDDGVNRLIMSDGIDAITTASPYSKTWSPIDTAKVYDILVLDNGDQWYATNNTLMFHDTTETKRGWFRFDPENNNVASKIITALALDKDGNLWVGTDSGLSFLDTRDVEGIYTNTAQFLTWTTADGLPDNHILDVEYDTANNQIWVGTANGAASIPFEVSSVEGDASPMLAEQWQLLSNYPNPFNPSTNIAFELPHDAHISLNVYNVNGQLVRQLADQRYAAGSWVQQWDGLDASGVQVNSGVYFARMIINTANARYMNSIKMLLVR